MRKVILKNWKRAMSLVMATVFIASGLNINPVQAAESDVYSMDFEGTSGTFSGAGGASAQLSSDYLNVADDSTSDTQSETKDELLTKKTVTMKLEAGGYTDGFVDLKALINASTKEDISGYKSIDVVFSVDNTEALSGATPSAKLYFQPNTTWNWCATNEVALTANTDTTISFPVSSINWGSGDTQVGAFGLQIVNIKEGQDVTVSIKSVKMIKSGEAASSSTSSYLKSGQVTLKYYSQYDATTGDIDLTGLLSDTSKADISAKSSIQVVMNVESADSFSDAKKVNAHVFFMGNQAWSWAVGSDVEFTAGKNFTVTMPTSSIKWGSADTSVGQCGVQLSNIKEGNVKYNIVSVKLLSAAEEPKSETKATTTSTAASSADLKDIGTAQSGDGFLYVSGRTNVLTGAGADLSDVLTTGNTYEISAWVKNIDAETDFIKMNWSKTAVSTGTTIAAAQAVKGEWVQLQATLSVAKSAKSVFLKFMSTNTNNELGIDNIVITQIDDGTTTKIGNYTVTDKDVADGTVTIEGKTFNNLTVDSSAADAEVVLKDVTVTGKLTVNGSDASKVELSNSAVNKFELIKVETSDIQSMSDDNLPTIVLGSGSNLLSFLTGANVQLTQEEQSVIGNITVTPGQDGNLQIVLKNVKCNVVVNSDPDSAINVVLEDSQLSSVTVNGAVSGGKVDFSGDTSSKISTFNMDAVSGITSTISTPVENLKVNSDKATIIIKSNVDNIVASGVEGNITVDKGVTIKTLTVDGDNSKVTSDGSIDTLTITGDHVTADVEKDTDVAIKDSTGASVTGSANVVGAPAAPAPGGYITPITTPVSYDTISILPSSYSGTLKAASANPAINLTSLFPGTYTSKETLKHYKYIEIKITFGTLPSGCGAGVYTMDYPTWTWKGDGWKGLTSNGTTTFQMPITSIGWGSDGNSLSLIEIGLSLYGMTAGESYPYTVESIKLVNPKYTDVTLPVTGISGSIGAWTGVEVAPVLATASMDSKEVLSNYSKIGVNMTISSLTYADGGTWAGVAMYCQPKPSYAWKDDWGNQTTITSGATITVYYDLSLSDWSAQTGIGNLGFRFNGVSNANYTVNSVVLVAKAE